MLQPLHLFPELRPYRIGSICPLQLRYKSQHIVLIFRHIGKLANVSFVLDDISQRDVVHLVIHPFAKFLNPSSGDVHVFHTLL